MKQKQIFGLLFLLLFLTGIVSGQTIKDQDLDFHIAPTFSRLNSSSDYIEANGINLGLKLGATVNFKLAEWVGLIGGFDFTMWTGGQLLYREGGNFLPNSNLSDPSLNTGEEPMPDNTNIRYSINYIEIPAGFQFEFPVAYNVDVIARIPVLTLGIRNRARGRIEAGSVVLEKQNIGKDVGFFNFMWGMALGAEFERWNQDVSLIVFLNTGLTDVTRDKGKQIIDMENGQRQTIKEDSKGALNQFGVQFAVKIK